jgi:GcrA cell cycle regulator
MRTSEWTPDLIERVRLLRADGAATIIIAREVGRHERSVYRLISDLELPASSRKWSSLDVETARKLRAAGATDAEVGKAVGRSKGAVQRHLKTLGIGRPVEYLPPPDWTDDDDEKLRELRDSGLPIGKIGDILGRTRNAVAGRCKRLQIGTPRKEPDSLFRHRTMVAELKIVKPIQGVSLLDAGTNQCRYIASQTLGRNTDCCGKPTLPGLSWCRKHFDKVRQPWPNEIQEKPDDDA